MKKVKGQPITGAQPEYSKARPYVPDAKETSADEQAMIRQAPTPFKDDQNTPNQPAPGAASGGISTMEPRIKSGLQHTSPGARTLPQGGPVGQFRPINQNGQMNGRMGTRFPRKVGGGDLPGKYPAKKNAGFFGEHK